MTADDTVAEVYRRLAAAPDRVFSAFSEAGLVSRWLTPSPDVPMTVLQFDFRVGGLYRFAYHVPGGGTMFVTGAYRVIDPPTTIVFSWNIEPPDQHAGIRSEVTVTITPAGSGSDLRIRHQNLSLPGAARRHADGWQGAIDQLTKLLSTGGRA
jgi:uncharacterized protein YndB with AHSA1/START domain